mgnify:CR=1 FL=1
MSKTINDYSIQTMLATSDYVLFQRGAQYYRIDAANSVAHLDSDDLVEGAANLYATNANIDTWLATKDSDDVTEGSTNLYATDANINAWLATKDLDDISDGSAFTKMNKTVTVLEVADVLALHTTPIKIVDTGQVNSTIAAVSIEVSSLGGVVYTTIGDTNLEIIAGNSAGTLFVGNPLFTVPITVLTHNLEYLFPMMQAAAAELRIPMNYDWYIRPDTADPTLGDIQYTVRAIWHEWG